MIYAVVSLKGQMTGAHETNLTDVTQIRKDITSLGHMIVVDGSEAGLAAGRVGLFGTWDFDW